MRTNAAGIRRTTSLIAVILLAGSLAITRPASPQSPAAPPQAAAQPLAFEVASIKASKSTQGYGVGFTPDGISARGVSLKYILRSAYNQYNDQLWSGAPAWLDSASFDIEAKFDPAAIKDPTLDQRRAMLQALLADRFKLVIHTETRDIPEYALVVLKGGPNLRDADPAKLIRDDSNKLYCRAGLTNFRQCTMAEFAAIARIVGVDRIVVDQTGLTGRYDFELHYAPPGASAPPGVDPPPDIYEAIQDQLRLKLQPTHGPASVLVIDHVERPTEN